MILKNGWYRIVLKRVPCIWTARIEAGTRNQITAVSELELKKTDRHRIDVKQWISHHAVRTLNLYATVGSGVVQVSRSIARRLRTDGGRQCGYESLSGGITLGQCRPAWRALASITRWNRRRSSAGGAIPCKSIFLAGLLI